TRCVSRSTIRSRTHPAPVPADTGPSERQETLVAQVSLEHAAVVGAAAGDNSGGSIRWLRESPDDLEPLSRARWRCKGGSRRRYRGAVRKVVEILGGESPAF